MKFSKGSGGTWCQCMGDLQCHVKSFERALVKCGPSFQAEVLLGKLQFVLDHSFLTLLLATEPSFQAVLEKALSIKELRMGLLWLAWGLRGSGSRLLQHPPRVLCNITENHPVNERSEMENSSIPRPNS